MALAVGDIDWRMWNKLTYIHRYGQRDWYRRDQDQNDESALKVATNLSCLQPDIQLLLFHKSSVSCKTSLRKGWPAEERKKLLKKEIWGWEV